MAVFQSVTEVEFFYYRWLTIGALALRQVVPLVGIAAVPFITEMNANQFFRGEADWRSK